MPNPIATFDTTEVTIKCEIYLEQMPITASNFIDQFGCPYSKDPKSGRAGTGGPPDGTFQNIKTGATETRTNGGNIQDENISKDSNTPGRLSMANTGRPNSGGSQ